MENKDVLKSFAQKAKRRLVGKEVKPNAKIKVISNEDSEFKNKVEFLLSQEKLVENPVKYLVDEKAMKHMDDASRERYLLATLDKFSALRNQLGSACNDNRFCM